MNKNRAKRIGLHRHNIWLLLIAVPIFCLIAVFIVRFFYGPVSIEIRNGLDHPVSIKQVAIKRCATCRSESIDESAILLASKQRGYINFNAKKGVVGLQFIVSQENGSSNVLNCDMNVVTTACEATVYMHNKSITCEPCTHY
jgi:hypothetical protein